MSDQVGLLYHEVHMMSVTKQVFANYIFNLKIILGAEPAVIILDNAPCHSNIDQDFPEVEIKYLPPYSPFLNPIENSFSVLKSAIKRHLQFNAERSHAGDSSLKRFLCVYKQEAANIIQPFALLFFQADAKCQV